MPFAKIDWKEWMRRTVCPKCIYYNECLLEYDCEAYKILVKIHEDLDSSDPDM